MRVGLDFDNTIVRYDSLFHRLALEGGWIPADLPRSKLSVRDHLRGIGREDVWTEMQGVAYGPRMGEAECFAGVREFLRWAREADLAVSIVSHKTRHPFIGPAHDLHEAARRWIEQSLRDDRGSLIDAASTFFELTKEAKCARIASLGCGVFVDDLPELLSAPEFPSGVEALLFDPDGHHGGSGLQRVGTWAELQAAIASRWRQVR